jgi:hypothetical protein
MLRCKTDSAKDRATGGPVSNSRARLARNSSRKLSGQAKYASKLKPEFPLTEGAFANVDNVARNVLQHGEASPFAGVFVGAPAPP